MMLFLKRIFFNPAERRTRALWRLLIQFPVTMIWIGLSNFVALFSLFFLSAAVGLVPFGAITDGAALNQALSDMIVKYPVLSLFPNLAVIPLFLLLFILLARFLDRRPWKAYGFQFNKLWWADMGFGLFLGALLISGIFAIQHALDWIVITGTMVNRISEFPFWIRLSSALLAFIFVGINEEVIMRGYQIRNLAEGLNHPKTGPKGAVLIAYLATSLVFGLLHANNPNATLYSTLNLAAAGLFLGLGFILTGQLALPIGLHITWNFFMGNVFGLPVSGLESSVTLISVQQSGPELWAGGSFGPEGGLISLFAMLAGVLLTLVWVRITRGKLQLRQDLAVFAPYKKKEKEADILPAFEAELN